MFVPNEIDMDFLHEPVGSSQYKSKLKKWYGTASVRKAPERIIDSSEEGYYFSPSLARVSLHPNLSEAQKSEYLACHLCSYLWFTSELEHQVVNEVTRDLALGRYKECHDMEIRYDAFKIYCDEAYHALFSMGTMMGVLRECSLPESFQRGLNQTNSFLAGKNSIVENASLPDMEARFTYAAISETLITGTLNKLPKDPRVKESVRAVVRDHAEDENLHHAYFLQITPEVWSQFSRNDRRAIVPYLPAWICDFIIPDFHSEFRNLEQAGVESRLAKSIVLETYDVNILLDVVRQTGRSTFKLFKSLGCEVLDGCLVSHIEHRIGSFKSNTAY